MLLVGEVRQGHRAISRNAQQGMDEAGTKHPMGWYPPPPGSLALLHGSACFPGLGSYRGHPPRVPVAGGFNLCHCPTVFLALEEPGHSGEDLRSCKVRGAQFCLFLARELRQTRLQGEAPPAGETQGWTSHSLGLCPLP